MKPQEWIYGRTLRTVLHGAFACVARFETLFGSFGSAAMVVLDRRHTAVSTSLEPERDCGRQIENKKDVVLWRRAMMLAGAAIIFFSSLYR